LQFQFFYFRGGAIVIPFLESEGIMRPMQQQATGSGDLFRARLEQIIDMGLSWCVSAQARPFRRLPDNSRA
jgi:hypothetical protein